jgi:YesN/AraC family two-component response regulator
MMKALIIEDELLARLGMRSLVDWEAMGIRLLEDAADGREALARIEKELPDLILLDLNIPEINGLEILKIIRQRHLPVKTIVVSCYDDFDTVKEAMKLGAVDYIRKFGLSKAMSFR